MDVVIISPEPGKVKEIGQQLLALAEHPRDVQWVTWPSPGGFSVPLELFVRFDTDGEDSEAAEAEATPKRRRRRNKESTDNNTSEEE